MINNNWYIKGGNGGENTNDGANAGVGGMGIYFNGVPDDGDPSTDNSAIKIIENWEIIGGNGGDNNAANDGSSGLGGTGIYIYDDDMTGSVNISGNLYIKGGDGGDSSATDSGSMNWFVGNGSNAITLDWCHFRVPVMMRNNEDITGGKGGNTTGIGNVGKTGFVGHGIWVWGSTNVSIETTNVTGGHGGNNTGMMIMAAAGGDGIRLDPKGPFISVAALIGVISIGGHGGDDYTGTAGAMGGAGTGGVGLAVIGDTAWCSANSSNSLIFGGEGGDSFANGGMGGMGSNGVYAIDQASVGAIGGIISGGKGGKGRFPGPDFFGSLGGGGGIGVRVENPGTSGFFDAITMIVGGDGGDVMFDPMGFPGFGGDAFISTSCNSITLMNSEIVTGEGGQNIPTGARGEDGYFGLYTDNIANPVNLDRNIVHEAVMYGIFVNNCLGNIDNNEVYNSTNPGSAGIYMANSNAALNSNYIHDNDRGIWTVSNSNPTISRCTIEDSGSHAMYVQSDPFLLNSTITGSGISDYYIIGDSHPVSLNTTSDKTVVIADVLSDLTMQWFMHTQVVDPLLIPVGGAEVWVNDTFGNNILNDFTPANGWINWTVVTEFIENQTARTYYTAHNATATTGPQTGWAIPEPFMDASREVIIVLGAPSFNIFLNQGWNLISLPLEQADASIDQVLRTIDGQWDFIRIFDPLDPEPWKSNCTYWPAFLNDFDTLDHPQGFWIRITTPTATLTVTGNIPAVTNIQLFAGWNLVGYPSFTEEQISVSLIGTGYDRPVEAFNASAPYGLGQLADTDVFKPGYGYWISVPVDTVWVVTNP
jgi:parallel beta-helix repeat protein